MIQNHQNANFNNAVWLAQKTTISKSEYKGNEILSINCAVSFKNIISFGKKKAAAIIDNIARIEENGKFKFAKWNEDIINNIIKIDLGYGNSLDLDQKQCAAISQHIDAIKNFTGIL